MSERPFNVLGVQQIAVGGLDKGALRRFWIDIMGLTPTGTYRAESETEMGRYGCLAVNTSAELGGESPEMAELATKYRNRMFETIENVIRRAADAGELDASQVDNHTTMLVTFMLGVSVTVRSGADAAAIGRVIDAAHATVDSWAVTG